MRPGLLLFVALLFVPCMATGQISWSSTVDVLRYAPTSSFEVYGCSTSGRNGGQGDGRLQRCSAAMSNTVIPTVGTVWSLVFFTSGGYRNFEMRFDVAAGGDIDALNGHVLNVDGDTVTITDATTVVASTSVIQWNTETAWLTWPWPVGTMCVQVYAVGADPPGCAAPAVGLPAPGNLERLAATDSTLTVSWRNVIGNDGYCVRINTGGARYRCEIPKDTTMHTFTGLEPNTEYHVSIYARPDGEIAGETFSTARRGEVIGTTPTPALPVAGVVLLGLLLAWGGREGR